MFRWKHLVSALGAGLIVAASPAQAQEGKLRIELNKIEPGANKCVVTFSVTNRLAEPLDKLTVELGIFDDKEILLQFTTVSFIKLPAGRRRIFQFDFNHECAKISAVHFNGLTECAGAKDMTRECEANIEVFSRATIPFTS